MICEHCKQRHATVTVTQIQNGTKFERHFCEVCAPHFHPFHVETNDEPVSIQQFISNWFGTPITMQNQKVEPKTTTCPSCGFSYRQFLKIGKFGCPTCYETFRQQLPSVLRKIQADVQHKGAKVSNEKTLLKLHEQLEELREQLATAVADERFEDAVKYRDAIRLLEQKLAIGGVDEQ